jgi:uncharacterized protein (DUF433 family)
MTAAATLAFTTHESERLTGLTPRRLQYWDETGFITPSVAARRGRGSPRLYSFQDLVQLRIAAQLRDRLSLQALRRLKAALDVDAPFAEVRFAVTTGGETVYLVKEGAPEAARTPGQIVETFQVPLEEIRADLRRRVADLRSRDRVGEIVRTRGVLGSQPTIVGTRITPQAIVDMLDNGWDRARIMDEFPDLVPADVDAAIVWSKTAKRVG